MCFSFSNAIVLYDRPPKIFRPLTLQEKHDWFLQLSKTYPAFGDEELNEVDVPNTKTLFTQEVNGKVELRSDRPGLLFSSTSWTADEDFGLLMEALQRKMLFDHTNIMLPWLCGC